MAGTAAKSVGSALEKLVLATVQARTNFTAFQLQGLLVVIFSESEAAQQLGPAEHIPQPASQLFGVCERIWELDQHVRSQSQQHIMVQHDCDRCCCQQASLSPQGAFFGFARMLLTRRCPFASYTNSAATHLSRCEQLICPRPPVPRQQRQSPPCGFDQARSPPAMRLDLLALHDSSPTISRRDLGQHPAFAVLC